MDGAAGRHDGGGCGLPRWRGPQAATMEGAAGCQDGGSCRPPRWMGPRATSRPPHALPSAPPPSHSRASLEPLEEGGTKAPSEAKPNSQHYLYSKVKRVMIQLKYRSKHGLESYNCISVKYGPTAKCSFLCFTCSVSVLQHLAQANI